MKDAFNKELSYIKNERIKRSLIAMINKLPNYFYEVPASSTGKYHPSFSLGEGGLLRHTKVAVRIAKELFNNPSLNNFTDDEKDLLIFALTLHDGLKSGLKKSEYTLFEHPILMSNYIQDNKDDLELTEEELDLVCRCIKTHMGPWTTNYKGEEVLEPPKDKYQRFVHLCDYIASRKFLDVKFNNNEIIE
ncbi:MAG: HD domain-containing protein [Bacilli bacterium]|nr:HD domain-containing protein [Bacilli bacterium]